MSSSKLTKQGFKVVTPTDSQASLTSVKNVLKENNVKMVIQTSRDKPCNARDSNYILRRATVDNGIPLVNDMQVAQALVKLFAYVNSLNGDPSEDYWKRLMIDSRI